MKKLTFEEALLSIFKAFVLSKSDKVLGKTLPSILAKELDLDLSKRFSALNNSVHVVSNCSNVLSCCVLKRRRDSCERCD